MALIYFLWFLYTKVLNCSVGAILSCILTGETFYWELKQCVFIISKGTALSVTFSEHYDSFKQFIYIFAPFLNQKSKLWFILFIIQNIFWIINILSWILSTIKWLGLLPLPFGQKVLKLSRAERSAWSDQTLNYHHMIKVVPFDTDRFRSLQSNWWLWQKKILFS
jgi:hypothetical protein